MNDQPPAGGRDESRRARKVRPVAALGELLTLRRRVTELESEVQEARRLHMRVAELLDLVEELLVPVAQRDEEKVRRFLDSHSGSL